MWSVLCSKNVTIRDESIDKLSLFMMILYSSFSSDSWCCLRTKDTDYGKAKDTH